MAFRITTSAFQNEGSIPVNFAREGANKSPIIRWEEVPAGTESFALVVEDPDAPNGSFYHWLVYDIPGETKGLAPDLVRDSEFPNGMKQGINDFGEVGFDGPQPPSGERHHYHFRLFALREPPGLKPGMEFHELMPLLEKKGILATAEIAGFYKSLTKKKKEVA